MAKLIEFRKSRKPLSLGCLGIGISPRDRDRARKRVDNSIDKLVDIRDCQLAFRSLILALEVLFIIRGLLGIFVFIGCGKENISLRILGKTKLFPASPDGSCNGRSLVRGIGEERN